ncbi:conserved Plasmodium protein, unknown function [Plasmodium ovale]|uniref:Calponin-homology (CH) domain-containing protein n=2 Tax=Plasmodium ovale TaxID=36330 RepID=A0A1C3KMH8_PLAOA|nr:conserved Plasmodium protein, unknown function [Plasmodium ovale]
MKTFMCENKGRVYNEITKCTTYAKYKETLCKTKWLEIHSFSIIIDWLNSLLICNKMLNEYNIYEEIKDGLLILKLIKIYKPKVEIHGIFSKAIKKKCAIQNLEKGLSIIYKNNPYYYSMVSSDDIYEKKKKKINILLIQLFDNFEFRKLKNISTHLLNWYNYTLRKFSLPLYPETVNNPFHVVTDELSREKPQECSERGKFHVVGKCKDGLCMQCSDINNNMEKNSFSNSEEYITRKQKQPCMLKNFATYVLYKDREEYKKETPYIIKDFADCTKIFFIFYRYGYITKGELSNVCKLDIRNNFFLLQNFLRKLNIPIIFQNQYLNNPSEVAILLQLKYIQCFIHWNGYEKAIDLEKEYIFSDLFRKKKGKKKYTLQRTCNILSENDSSHNAQNNSVFSECAKGYSEGHYDRNGSYRGMQKDVYVELKNKTAMHAPGAQFYDVLKRHTKQHDGSEAIEWVRDETNSKVIEKGNGASNTNYTNFAERCETAKMDQGEHADCLISARKKKKKIENCSKLHTHKKKKELNKENEYLEKEIFRRTPIKSIRKMFHRHIEEHMNSHKAEDAKK